MRTLKLLATITIIIQFTSCAEANFDVKIESNSIDCFKQKDINTDTDYYIALVSYAKAKDHLILYSIKNENKTKLEILKGTFGYHHLRLGIKKTKTPIQTARFPSYSVFKSENSIINVDGVRN